MTSLKPTLLRILKNSERSNQKNEECLLFGW